MVGINYYTALDIIEHIDYINIFPVIDKIDMNTLEDTINRLFKDYGVKYSANQTYMEMGFDELMSVKLVMKLEDVLKIEIDDKL